MTFGRNPYENEPSDRYYDDAHAQYEEYVEEVGADNARDFDSWLDDQIEEDRRDAEEARAEAILDARKYDY